LFTYNYAISKYGKPSDKKQFNITAKELQKPFEKLFE
jgi:hypothetical protein